MRKVRLLFEDNRKVGILLKRIGREEYLGGEHEGWNTFKREQKD